MDSRKTESRTRSRSKSVEEKKEYSMLNDDLKETNNRSNWSKNDSDGERSSRSKSKCRSKSIYSDNDSKSRSRSRNISRSRSRSSPRRSRSRDSYRRDKYRRRTRTRSRSRYYSRRRDSRSPSPYYKRLDPSPCRVLGVFGLSLATEERDIKHTFEKYGHLDKVKLVTDPRTNKSRGFAFVYFTSVHDAQDAKENLHGYELEGHHIRVEYSISNKEHNPTPGIYMGRSYRDSYRGSRYDDDRDRYSYRSGYGSSRRYSSRTRSRSRSYDRRRRSYSRD